MTDSIAAVDLPSLLEREEVFENETTIFYTYEVDPAYRVIVDAMARAIYQHDNGLKAEFPTENEEVDAPYRCRADDALREGLPLLRAKLAGELRAAVLTNTEGE